MTNGPKAKVAESVSINLPRPRDRASIIENPDYYKIRNYLVNFLVTRSHELTSSDDDSPPSTVSVDPTELAESESKTPDQSTSMNEQLAVHSA